MILNRVIAPASKLATAKALDPEIAASSLGVELELEPVDEDELTTALDWLRERRAAIEATLAKHHLQGGMLVLDDVSSRYVEGSVLPARGARLQPRRQEGQGVNRPRAAITIACALLCVDRDAAGQAGRDGASTGRHVAIEVFEGNAEDPSTVAARIAKLKDRFGLDPSVLVGDRGMITRPGSKAMSAPPGSIGSRRRARPRRKPRSVVGRRGSPSCDEREIAAITAPAFPGERLIVCRNPDLTREREDRLAATERFLAPIAAATARKRHSPRGAAAIGMAVGAVSNKHK